MRIGIGVGVEDGSEVRVAVEGSHSASKQTAQMSSASGSVIVVVAARGGGAAVVFDRAI